MVSITVDNGSAVQVDWTSGMNAQTALERAYSQITFGITYYGSSLGYLVVMLNGAYDSPTSGYYWAFYYNGQYATQGIDYTILNDGDSISFVNTSYNEEKHKGTLLEVKHEHAQKYL